MRVSVFGLGYVGCVTAASLAARAHRVVGVDTNLAKIRRINAGESPVVEPGLDRLIHRVVARGRLRATRDWRRAIEESDLAMVCVGTPSLPNGNVDLKFLRRISEQIGHTLRSRRSHFEIVIRSTILPGTIEESIIPTIERLSGKRAGSGFGICFNPEFMREGSALADFAKPTRIVIGQFDGRSGEALAKLYANAPGRLIRTNLRDAEMIKYADNAFHAVKVAFTNEISRYCTAKEVDARTVMKVFCADRKLNISSAYLVPGFAFGGSCLPKDLRALISSANAAGIKVPLLESILPSNELPVDELIEKLLQQPARRIGFLGISFKSGTDDLRHSPVLRVIKTLLEMEFSVAIHDPHVVPSALLGSNREFTREQIPGLRQLLRPSPEAVLRESEVVIVSHKCDSFRRALRGKRREQEIFRLTT